jgi:hypothetical protein
MTVLTKPVTRESACFDRGRPLVVTLHPRHIEIRPKGLRSRYTVSYDACMWVAIKREIENRKREKAARKRKGAA